MSEHFIPHLWQPDPIPGGTLELLPYVPGHGGLFPAATVSKRMGINVGDLIVGREEGPGYWRETKLTLLWRGDSVCVWYESNRDNRCGGLDWGATREAAGQEVAPGPIDAGAVSDALSRLCCVLSDDSLPAADRIRLIRLVIAAVIPGEKDQSAAEIVLAPFSRGATVERITIRSTVDGALERVEVKWP